MQESPGRTLADRVAKLERENRLWRWAGGFALLAGLVVVGGGAQKEADPKVVDAERLIIRDAGGKERIRLGIAPDGSPALVLLGEEGGDRAILQAAGRGNYGSLRLFAAGQESGGPSVALDAGNRSANVPSFSMRHESKRRIDLNVDTRHGRPWMKFADERGTLFEIPEPVIKKLAQP